MLATIAYVSGHSPKEWIGSFLVAFAVWDLFYYAFLRVISGWPNSLLDLDVYFLIPVPWVGPVVTPLVASTLLLILGVRLFAHK
ncbi:MAG: hypothetical protein HYU75_12055 [Betaproteobacteria bacterium]|nr:hypothetical protein [Betaproteobacteria bacterium]